MNPIITAVRWYATNVPWGIDFDNINGKFMGVPTQSGEYVVSVTVETMCGSMYIGSDAKDVTVIVEPPSYPIQAIGQRAAVWSNQSSPSDGGFYQIGALDKAYKLSSVRNGFIALTSGKIPYCCGTFTAYTNQYGFSGVTDMFSSATTPIDITQPNNTGAGAYLQGVERTICGTTSYTETSGNTTSTYEHAYVWQVSSLPRKAGDDVTYYSMKAVYGSGIIKRSGSGVSDNNKVGFNSGGTIEPGSSDVSGWSKITGGLLFSDAVSGNTSFLCENGTKRVTFTDGKGIPTAKVTDLGYRAKKYLNGTNFKCLSEDGRLDNNASNFSYGVIKDAWCLGKVTYALTPTGVLYEYDPSSKTWNTCGYYDVQKLFIPNSTSVFMLTNECLLCFFPVFVQI